MSKQQIKRRYLPDNVTTIIKSIELEVLEDESIVFIGQSLANRGINAHKWSEFKSSNLDNKPVLDTMLRIETILEHRLVTGALANKLNTTMAIFVLKNKYGYKDSKQVDNTHIVKPILGGLSNKVIDVTPVNDK